MKTINTLKHFNINSANQISLPCTLDEKDQVIEVRDYQGNVLQHNKEARQVLWNGKRLYY
ncbi:hypothetical protein [Acinetobacter sp. KS-LM10]|uniref:hypothetical protein n=1 Tax=Acinetobacter sp. KS-LM10 TaxID=3120518 RepID=UPI0030CE6DC0